MAGKSAAQLEHKANLAEARVKRAEFDDKIKDLKSKMIKDMGDNVKVMKYKAEIARLEAQKAQYKLRK